MDKHKRDIHTRTLELEYDERDLDKILHYYSIISNKVWLKKSIPSSAVRDLIKLIKVSILENKKFINYQLDLAEIEVLKKFKDDKYYYLDEPKNELPVILEPIFGSGSV